MPDADSRFAATPFDNLSQSDFDALLMRALVRFSRRGLGNTWPNPSVGALLVQMNAGYPVIVGQGVTAPGGRPHAEVVAIREAGEAARGATLYVTLEPCSHFGQTPPCSQAIIEAGIGRVVVALEDPDKRVAGRGFAMLEAAGIPVVQHVASKEACSVLGGYMRRQQEGRPDIQLKIALSADEMIGREEAGQVAISGARARAHTHMMRARADAILIGSGTALADDPALTCRLPGLEGASPVRIVLDSRASLPIESKLAQTARDVPVWLMVGADIADDKRAALRDCGVLLFDMPVRKSGQLDLEAVFEFLGEQGLTRVMVEGGGILSRALLSDGLVDEVVLIKAPVVVGQDGIPAFGGLALATVERSSTYAMIEERREGDDLIRRYIRRRS